MEYFFFLVIGCFELLKINLWGVNMVEDVILEEIVKKMDGYSGVDIINVCWFVMYIVVIKCFYFLGFFYQDINEIIFFYRDVFMMVMRCCI